MVVDVNDPHFLQRLLGQQRLPNVSVATLLLHFPLYLVSSSSESKIRVFLERTVARVVVDVNDPHFLQRLLGQQRLCCDGGRVQVAVPPVRPAVPVTGVGVRGKQKLAVERIRHIKDSQGQILALAFR